MNELLYTIWISLACTPGHTTFAKLLKKFKTAKEIYETDEYDLKSCIGSKARDYDKLLDKNLDKANKILEFCKNKNVGIVTYFDTKFPNSLRKIKNPPVLLYYRGILPDFEKFFFASIVGTRSLSDYGRKHTFSIARDLSRSGAIIVSGMAVGIDGVAHAGALSSGKPTIAILGCGINVCYPSIHKHLAQQIVKTGCIMTEYAPGTKPERYNFPVRNRLISGMSAVTIVIEGKDTSGSILTARHAKEQGRDLYAFPGNVGNTNSEATNLLIKNGAKLITDAYDIVGPYENIAVGKIHVYKLLEKSPVDMFEVLREYKIACVTPSDDIFKPPFPRKRRENKKTQNKETKIIKETKAIQETQTVKEEKEEIKVAESSKAEETVSNAFDVKVFELYRKIPVEGDCSTDSLVGEKHTLQDVMTGLIKLEISGFVTMLPGDRVRRNIGKR